MYQYFDIETPTAVHFIRQPMEILLHTTRQRESILTQILQPCNKYTKCIKQPVHIE